jgi:hypothetical protein
MNFEIVEMGKSFKIIIKSSNGSETSMMTSDGVVRFPLKKWKKLMAENTGSKIALEIISESEKEELIKYNPIYFYVSNEPVDPFLCYRLLYPGYESWNDLKIIQRSTESFDETSIFENKLLDNNCVNCHCFLNNNPDKFLLHVRGSNGGTYFINGKNIVRRNLQAENMPANAVYPSWHPGGRYVAFSSNKTVQSFYMKPEKNIEVYDLFSSLVIYNIESNSISVCKNKGTVRYMETFPCWSPDGNYLYFCQAKQTDDNDSATRVQYNLARRHFDQKSGELGDAEIIFNAQQMNKSVSFPSLSPDGKYIVFVLIDYGTFSIWHKEADLYLYDLKSGKVEKMKINSDDTESYNSWSSNGRWIVFSSKRDDGLTARPYIAYIDSLGNTGKPFVLPQKNPAFYKKLDKTFNRPEFITGKILAGPRDFARAARIDAVKAVSEPTRLANLKTK